MAPVSLMIAGAGLLLLAALWLRIRLPAPAGVAGVAVGGAAVAAGVLLLEPAARPADWTVALPAAAGLALLHVRMVLGRFGPTPA